MEETINKLREIDSIIKNVLNRPLNICILCSPGMGGSGIMGSSVASNLSSHGHTVHLVSYKKPFRLENKDVRIHKIPLRKYQVLEHLPEIMSTASKLYDVVKKNDIDIINAHYAIPFSTSSYLAREMFRSEGIKVPVVTTVHGTDIHTIGQKKELKDIVRFTLKSSDGITTVSNYLAKIIKNRFDLDKTKVIYNYIDTERFQRTENPKLKKRLGNGKKIIIHSSNFRSIKRVGDIIDAFRIIRKNVPCVLVLVGDGPDMKLAKKKVSRYKMSKDVIFTGRRKDIEKFYSVSDLFVFASVRESFGLSLLEAMSCSVPVVSTKSGGPQEIVENGKTGYLVNVGDVNGIADKAIEILTDDEKREEMGKNARKKVLSDFTPAKIIPQYEAYYRRILTS